MGPKKGRLAGLIAANENKSQSSQSNTTNITSNQPTNASNSPPSVQQPTELLLNQNLQNELYYRIRNYGNSKEFFSMDNNMYIIIDFNNNTVEELILIFQHSTSREDFNILVKLSPTIKYQLYSRIKPGDPVKSSTRSDGICNLWVIFQLDDRNLHFDKRLIQKSFRDDPTKMTEFDVQITLILDILMQFCNHFYLENMVLTKLN